MYKERKKIGLYKKKKVGSCDVHTRSNAFDNARDVLIRTRSNAFDNVRDVLIRK
jgi:hypothetical protein